MAELTQTGSPLPLPVSRPSIPSRTVRFGLPDQRTLLTWLFVGRVALAVATLIRAALVWTQTPDVSFIVSIGVLFAFLITAYGAYHTLIRSIDAGIGFLYVQSLADLGLVTLLVHLSGPHGGGVAALYVLVIAAYALLLPLRAGILTALMASGLYLGEAILARSAVPDAGFWGQVTVFSFVFVVVAFLGQRLRAAAAEQSELATELRRVRLEADEILKNIRSGVITVDGQGRLAFINPTAERLLDLSGQGLMGRPVLDQLEARSRELWHAIVEGIRKGRRVNRAEGSVLRSNGKQFPIGLSTTTFARESELQPSVTAIFTDISDLQQMQELHLRAERLEAVAALSASLAHEIRNPLASIRSSVEQLGRSPHADADERFLGQLVIRESDRLTRLLNEFLDFSRVRATNFKAVNLYTLAVDAVRLVREHPECVEGVEVQVIGERTILDADEDLIHRVVSNLVLNAVQAMGEKGKGRVVVTVDTPSPNELPNGSEFEQPVRLRVQDNGPGIEPELRERLFQPFVSGRPGGSGLGLAIVQRAVEAHRGLVLVDSAPDQGTTFTIYLHSKWPSEDTE